MTGIEMIAAERQRQIEVEGWTAEHDRQHDQHELAQAAMAYMNEALACCGDTRYFLHPAPGYPAPEWPWAPQWWKPSEDPVRNMVKAGALLAAEIDRLKNGGADG